VSDALDRADLEIQRTVEIGVAKVRASLAAPRGVIPKGYCHNCDTPFPGDKERLFCDEDCHDDHVRITENQRYK
jgi:hypothetical protein